MNGSVVWIGVRPERKGPVQSRTSVYADQNEGLSGDHDTKPYRQMTLISKELLDEVAKKLGVPDVDPALTRRNIKVSGLDFALVNGAQLRIGNALIEITGPCLPCSRMDENLGEGGRTAMADAGGLTARILKSGYISVGDRVEPVLEPAKTQAATMPS